MSEISKANNPSLKSWIEVKAGSDFPIQNIPFGVYRRDNSLPLVATIIGEHVIDLSSMYENGFLRDCGLKENVFRRKSLNAFISLGKSTTRKVREKLSELFRHDNPLLRDDIMNRNRVMHRVSEVELLLPVEIGDYTDFYSSIHHATNVGMMFRDPEKALLPNWKHLPVGYHGRVSTIYASGHSFYRPKGQTHPKENEPPVFGPTLMLDFELETAFVVGKETAQGECITTASAEEYIFGMMLFNDWSARDIQTWEYVPLGPFLAKNFASTISPWVVTLDALESFRCTGFKQEPEVLPYLRYEGDKNIDINLEVCIKPEKQKETRVCLSNYKYLYWTMEQQLAHHTVNGCSVRVGDIMASGTISGPASGSFGSMLEITWRGTRPVTMSDGSERKFILDQDTVIMRGWSEKEGVRIGFGECRAKVLPAK
ncbi:MAG: fumarylacetoacetase [Bacteroidia bacterium]|nr:fumarylacetoacetase [Bacteroidia bacterium]